MNNELDRLKIPAIGLMVAGILNGATGLLILIGGLFRLMKAVPEQAMPIDGAEKFGFIFGTFLIYGIAAISLLATPVIIYGAIQMMKGKRAGLAKLASVLAIIPVTACCFVVGIPFGIWSLVVLSKPEVKAVFDGTANPTNYDPPQPPNF